MSEIGLVAPSSPVPRVELELGVELLREAGFAPRLHPQVLLKHLFFAGEDQERAEAFYEFARDPSLPILWCARGGYGAARILPWLERFTVERGVPRGRKLLVGASDSTALFEFVRARWGWATLHAPMPGLQNFQHLNRKREWEPLMAWVRKTATGEPWGNKALKHLGGPVLAARGELAGGNLAVGCSLAGTPHAWSGRGKLLFLEDVTEPFYRIDRMVVQLRQAGFFEGARALMLGNFMDCEDRVPMTRATPKAKKADRPLRPKLTEAKALAAIFGALGDELGFPVYGGLPVGHGPARSPLPMGADYELTAQGVLRLISWNWLGA